MQHARLPLLFLASFLAWTPAASGADVVQGANLLAMGGVGAAAPADNASVTVNPGLLGLQQRYDFHAHFGVDHSLGLQWGATAVDARTSDIVTLGFAYSADRFEPPLRDAELPGWSLPDEEIRNRKRTNEVAASASVALFDRKIAIGTGAVANRFQHDRQGSGTHWDLHSGIGVRPIEALTIGVAVRDWLSLEGEDRPLQVLGGVRGESDVVAVEADVGWQPEVFLGGSSLQVGAGAEVAAGSLRLRAGGRHDGPSTTSWLTGGLGYSNEGAGLDYGLAVPLSRGVSSAGVVPIHRVSVRFGAPSEIRPE